MPSKFVLPLFIFLMVSQPDSPAGADETGPLADLCDAPAEITADDTALDQLSEAIRAGGQVEVLAIGSASMLAPETGEPGTAFPYRMIEELRTAYPGVSFGLTLRGGRGLTAAQMLATIETTLPQAHFKLVLWQTGTVEAVEGKRPEDLYQVLEQGASQIRAAGGDLVLIDQPFSRMLQAKANPVPYERMMLKAAELPGVAIFHRYALMHYWVSRGRFDLERTARTDRQRVAMQLHDCLGAALARLVVQGVALATK